MLKFSSEFITESKEQEIKDQKSLAGRLNYGYKLQLYDLDETKRHDESHNQSQLGQNLQQLNNNCSLLLPFYCSVDIDGEARPLPEEYGFLHFTKQQGKIKGICYNPSNNRIVNIHLENYFERLTPELVVKCSSWNTFTPISAVNSGPWVIRQIQAILNKEIDLIARPHRLVAETNLSSVRLSQCSFILSSTIGNQHSTIANTTMLRRN